MYIYAFIDMNKYQSGKVMPGDQVKGVNGCICWNNAKSINHWGNIYHYKYRWL